MHENLILILDEFLFPNRTNAEDLAIRMGEYDMGTTDEPLDHVERGVKTIVNHPKYRGSYSDIALQGFIDLHSLIEDYSAMEDGRDVTSICSACLYAREHQSTLDPYACLSLVREKSLNCSYKK